MNIHNSKIAKLLGIAYMFTLLLVVYAQTSSALPANGKIAFTSHRDGNSEIYVMNADGTGQTRLTNTPDVEDYPTWSPDGRKIAFLAEIGGVFSINLMDADGTNVRQVTILFSGPQGMSWSPDGSKIAFDDSPATIRDIFAINIDGSNRVNLTNGQGYNYQPTWSPDGSRIAFTRIAGSYSTIYTMNADGGNVRQITYCERCDNWGGQSSPDWSPDGGQIVFRDSRQNDFGEEGISVVNPDGTNLRKVGGLSGILNLSYYSDVPKWSPDGTKIVFGTTGGLEHPGPYQIWAVNRDGSGLTQVTDNSSNNFNPGWQPLVPTASLSGRVTTPEGSGLRNALVTLINGQGLARTVTSSSFGFYSFDSVATGSAYTIAVSSRRYRYAPRSLQIDSSLTNVDFVGLE